MILGSVGDATCDVYKLPYHGEGRPTPSLLQERLNPSAVVISVGPNTEGLPSPTTLERLKLANISTWRTDVNGDIQVIADLNETYSIGPRAGANQTGAG